MKTFGELVTQIKRGILELSQDLLGPGAAQTLGPAHAYGKSFLIQKSVSTLKEAISAQESHLAALVGNEGTGAVQGGDTKLWRVVDSIFQSLSLIDRYEKDPSRYTHQGVAEWLRQEATNCGLSTSFISSAPDMVELDISGKKFTLELMLSEHEDVTSAKIVVCHDHDMVPYDLPELVEMLAQGQKTHVSHLLSMAARLDTIENEGPGTPTLSQLVGHIDCIPMRISLGGMRFPLVEGYEAVLTLDSYEKKRGMLMVVVDPPIVFPLSQLGEISKLCGVRFNIEPSVASSISAMLQLPRDVVRTIGGRSVRLLLNDESVASIMLARLPLNSLDNFREVVNMLSRAAAWCRIITNAFTVEPNHGTGTISIDVAPSDTFSLGVTFWVREFPARLNVIVRPDGFMDCEAPNMDQFFGEPTMSFDSIIEHLPNA